MFYVLSLLIFISFSYTSDKAELMEISFGRNYPTGDFGDRYADDGFSFKVSYSKSFENNGLFKYQFAGQYIHFGSSYYQDQLLLQSGFNGPTLDVRNREQALLFSGGVRFTATNGIAKKGMFRPYIGASVGLAFFSEQIRWDYGNDSWSGYGGCSGAQILLSILFQNNWCDDEDTYFEDTIHSNIEPVFTLDLGSNLFFKDDQKIGVDFGVRYNMVTGLKKPDIVYETINNYGILTNTNSYIIEKLKVDYYTLYFGLSFKLDPSRKDKKKYKRAQGRHI